MSRTEGEDRAVAERLVDDLPGPLQVRMSQDESRCLAEMTGELDVSNSERLRAELLQLLDEGCRDLTIDMSGLALIDSTGLGVLVGVMKRVLQHGGQMQLRAPRPAARKVFDITGLDRVFTIID
jgi:anti-sigma B factor antagonist